MGLFDYVRCEYPLPGNPPECAATANFQTKDLTCYLEQYVITADGRLVHESGDEDHSIFTGTIDLDWSNITSTGPGVYTANGEDAQYLEYRCTFIAGKVADFKEVNNSREPAAKRKIRQWTPLTAEQKKQIENRRAEKLLGRTLIIWWGGNLTNPYRAVVIAENKRELVVRVEQEAKMKDGTVIKNIGEFETIHRSDRDRCFFDSMEDGQAYEDKRKSDWEAEKKEYEDEIRAKTLAG
jgi:hypothetical protein